ncbi:MAG: redoxin domain-containing protein [Acidobacteria bacterium]|nr:redoxin domain-containing protein [Acidobacteriota bacterium]NIM61800.1 redoxin domain-containing protein [Acidobacteriota bacterium]NIO58211.1 redoxin domain-containing protein [Acidobacteriota bacterium]NIQ29228.1 redoxin domain-containing protein [Acidobacteriota bacterium]NIQ83805.1 redoxin domain-containing protein [Acidobacteriota bacterium]
MAATEQVEGEDSVEFHKTHMSEIFGDGFSFSGYERDLVKLNDRNGRFIDVSGISGADSISDGRGTVYADFDNDGDPDIFLTAMQRKAHYLFRNNIGQEANYLRVELIGTDSGTDAYGAAVEITTPSGSQRKVKMGGTGYLSQSDGRLLFGLGADETVRSLTIRWPNGIEQSFENIEANRSVRVLEGRDDYRTLTLPTFSFPEPWNPAEQLLADAGLRIGDRFPTLLLDALPGGPRTFEEVGGHDRKTLVNLWATWCTSCVREMPELNRMAPGFSAAGIDVVGISLDFRATDSVVSYLQELGIDYPGFIIREQGMELLFPGGEIQVPLTFLLAADGTIEGMWAGWTPSVERELFALTGMAQAR